MKTVTLKLTKEEFAILENENLSHRGIGLPFTYIDTRSKGIDILDVDKFREFLNDEIKTYVDIYNKLSKQGMREYNILKSVLAKLDDAEDRCNLWKIIKKSSGFGMRLYSDYTIADVRKYNRKGSLFVQVEAGGQTKDTYLGSREVAVKLAREILAYYEEEK